MGSGAAARPPSLLALALVLLAALCPARTAPAPLQQVLNITRIDGGDVFFITGNLNKGNTPTLKIKVIILSFVTDAVEAWGEASIGELFGYKFIKI